MDFDREFHGGTLRWIQPVLGVPGELTVTTGVDYDRSRDDRRGYQSFSGDALGVKGELRRDEDDIATSLDPYIQARWALGNWTMDAGLRHSTMEMEVDDHYRVNGDSSGSKKYQQNNPSISIMYALPRDYTATSAPARGSKRPHRPRWPTHLGWWKALTLASSLPPARIMRSA